MSGREQQAKLEMERVRGYTQQLGEVLRHQQEFARERESLERVDLNALVKAGLLIKETALTERHVSLLQDLQPLPPLRLAPKRFSRVFLYLLDNAMQACLTDSANKKPRIKVSSRFEENRIIMEMNDNGEGFQTRGEHLFSLGFTTREGGRGFRPPLLRQCGYRDGRQN